MVSQSLAASGTANDAQRYIINTGPGLTCDKCGTAPLTDSPIPGLRWSTSAAMHLKGGLAWLSDQQEIAIGARRLRLQSGV